MIEYQISPIPKSSGDFFGHMIQGHKHNMTC